MRVILVNRFFPPDVSATSQLLGDLAAALAARGVDVGVVASRQRIDAPEARPVHVASHTGGLPVAD